MFWSLELGMEETLANLQALDGDQVAAACRTTLSILVQNAMENVENKIAINQFEWKFFIFPLYTK